MTQLLAVDENNDLYLNRTGNIAISRNLEAVLQACEHIAKAQLLEMVLAQERGIPNFETIWNGSPNVAQFEAYLRRNILTVEGVIDILELETSVINNILAYNITIKTVYGLGVVNG
jgi:hypothetical protein